MKKYKTTIIITTLITLLPIVIGLFLWNKLPDTLATHWGSDGTANGWSSKTFSVFGMPLILTAIHVLCLFVTLNDPKKKNIHKKPMALIFWLVPVISLLANCSTYLIALGVDFSIEIFISALIGVFFIVLGNYMPKLQQNYTIGIKLPWTLNSEENWNRTHRLGGKLYIVMGIAMIPSTTSPVIRLPAPIFPKKPLTASCILTTNTSFVQSVIPVPTVVTDT